MNDTITLSKRQQEILRFCIFSQKPVSSSDIFEGISLDSSLVTIKRDVSELSEYGYIIKEGTSTSTKYTISILGRINTIIDIQKFSEIETDKRFIDNHYNFDLFNEYSTSVFSLS